MRSTPTARMPSVLLHFAVAGHEHEVAGTRVRDYADDPGELVTDLRVSKVRRRIVPREESRRSAEAAELPSGISVGAWTAGPREPEDVHLQERGARRRIERSAPPTDDATHAAALARARAEKRAGGRS